MSKKFQKPNTSNDTQLLLDFLNRELQKELDSVISEKGITQKDWDEI